MNFYEKLIIAVITIALTRIFIRLQEITNRQKEKIEKEINYFKNPPVNKAIIKGSVEHYQVMNRRNSMCDLKASNLIEKKKSLERIAYWEILFWMIIVSGTIIN